MILHRRAHRPATAPRLELRTAATSALLVMVVCASIAGCDSRSQAPVPAAATSTGSSFQPILDCGLVTLSPLKAQPARWQETVGLYRTLSAFPSLQAAAKYVSASDPARMSATQWADLVLMTLGLDVCTRESPGDLQAVHALERSLVPLHGAPDPGGFGPMLCPEVNNLASIADFRFAPWCAPGAPPAPSLVSGPATVGTTTSRLVAALTQSGARTFTTAPRATRTRVPRPGAATSQLAAALTTSFPPPTTPGTSPFGPPPSSVPPPSSAAA